MMNERLQKLKNKNFYELLGIEPGATLGEIKLAYREMVLIYHPDSNYYSDIIDEPPTKRSEEIFNFITIAYTTLSSPQLRSDYDIQLKERAFLSSEGLWYQGAHLQEQQTKGQALKRGEFGKPLRNQDSGVDHVSFEELKSLNDRLWGKSSLDRVILAIGYGVPICTLFGAAFFLLAF